MNRIAITIALCAVASASAQAQRSTMNTMNAMKSRSAGFFLGAGFEGTGIRSTDAGSPTESGAGGGLLVGYGLKHARPLFAQRIRAGINENNCSGPFGCGPL